jgi:serine/threonine protein kinase/Tol biopolymer transport system component
LQWDDSLAENAPRVFASKKHNLDAHLMILERDVLLHNRYRIQKNLGQGGMGSVFLATDENLGVDVAVKENLFTTEEYARQFRLEAVILANIRHPNLPRVSDHFVIAGEGQYLIMDFIDGEDLRQRMERAEILPEDEVIQIGAAMCDALSYLHSRKPPILHRDIKPGNVKISPDGHIFLVDFGLAKVIQGNQATTTGARAMTPGYSPPEQYGTARTDPRTDIYSLGATLYAALTGIIPEDGLARAMDSVELTPIRKRNPDITRRLAIAIEKAMEVDPSDRFQTADEFKMALLNSKSRTQQLLGTYTIPPPPVPSEDQTQTDTPKPASELVHSTPVDYAFVSPKKKQRERTRQARLSFLAGLATTLLIVFLLAAFFFPQMLPPSVRAAIPFLPTLQATPTQLALPIVITPNAELPTATAEMPTATLTPENPVATVHPGSISTPFGANYLELAYASIRSGIAQIYITGILKDDARLITNMSEGACQPSWSPDGTKMVFTSPCSGKMDTYPQSNLYIMNMDGSGQELIPSQLGGDFEPAWSPNGKYIAFTSMRDGYMQIYSYNVDTKRVDRLTETPEAKNTRQPTWSPDSQLIAFAYKRVDSYEIWVMSSVGGNPQKVFSSGSALSSYQPIWAPDGKSILFNQKKVDTSVFEFPSLFSLIYGSDKAPRSISLPTSSAEDVDYSPDGIWVAYESGGERFQHVYYCTPSGAGLDRITDEDQFEDFDPAWRPLSK